MFSSLRWSSGRFILLALWGTLMGLTPAQAHLMAAQKGTLNLVGAAAFMVLSVPVSALKGVDQDADGLLSKDELTTGMASIRSQVNAHVQLRDASGLLPLQLMMLDIAPPESIPLAPAKHLVVLGRFQLKATAATKPETALVSGGLTLQFNLFGTQPEEQAQDITITREQETQWLRFTPEQVGKAVLPDALTVFVEYVRTGASHVLGGADHMLFLLVVLSAGWRWRALLGALTCFTAGHALTLVACVWGGWSVSERIVEPAIAATIVGMAAFDAWTRWRAQPAAAVHPGLRLTLVFACALIHGLGLAGALGELTAWPQGSAPMAWALAGFNVGIEVAQVGVTALAGLIILLANRLTGTLLQPRVFQAGSVVGMTAGMFWLIERVIQGA